MGFISTCVFYWYLKRENAKRDRGERDELIVGPGEEKGQTAPGGVYESVSAAKIDKGDKWSGYRCVRLCRARANNECRSGTRCDGTICNLDVKQMNECVK